MAPEPASHPLARLFEPRAVAVVGASETPGKYGFLIPKTLIEEGYPGAVHLVNPKGGALLGRPFLPALDEVPGPIDVALVVRPALECPAAVAALARRGVPFVIVYAAGFAEMGPEGEALQREMVEAARGGGTRVVGPNGMNVASLPARLNLSAIAPLPSGTLGFLSASGNLAYALAQEAARRGGIGFSRFVSVGNQADLALDEFLDFLRADPATRAVLVYLEGSAPGRGRALLEALARAAAEKPVLVLRGGRTREGRRAAISHTAALVGEDELARQALEQAGAVLLDRADEALAIAEAFLASPLPAGPRVVLVGEGGGHATLLSDLAVESGLRIEPLPERLVEAVRRCLPPFAATVRNPVELGGISEADPRVYEKVLAPILEWPGCDLAVLFGGYALYDEALAEWLAGRRAEAGKPILLHDLYAEEPRLAFAPLRKRSLPLFASADVAVRAAAALARGGRARLRARRSAVAAAPTPHEPLPAELREALERARARSERALLEDEAARLLARFGVPVLPAALARDAEEAVAAAARLGHPVVVKAHAPELVHKARAGGVRLDLRSADEVRAACRAVGLGGAAVPEVRVTPFRPGGVELLAGARRDLLFGPVLAFGAGGALAELLRDVALRTLPCAEEELDEMVREPRIADRLRQNRVPAAEDPAGPRAALAAIARLILAVPEVAEVEVNPLRCAADGIVALDARVIVMP